MPRAVPRGWHWPAPFLLWTCLLGGYAGAGLLAVPAVHDERLRVAAVAVAAVATLGGAVLCRGSSGVLSARARDRILAAGGILGVILAGAALRAEEDRDAWPLPVHPRDVEMMLEGVVLDTGEWDAEPPRAVVSARRVAVGEREAPARARIEIRLPRGGSERPPLRAGLGVRVAGRYRPPEDARNFGITPPGFWLQLRGLEGTLHARPERVVPVEIENSEASLLAVLRASISDRLRVSLAPPVSALARGMALGERAGIAPEIREAFRDGGTIHILSISGLHVCILAGIVALVVVTLRAAPRVGFALEMGALWLYVALVGAPAPALRSALLWTSLRAGRLRGHDVPPLAALGTAGLLLQLVDPGAPLDPGFQLSFAAVLGLGVASSLLGPGEETRPGRGRIVGMIRGAWRVAAAPIVQSAGATASTMGLQAALVGSIPWIGLLLNAVVVPLCALFLAETILFLVLSVTGLPWINQVMASAVDASGVLLLLANRWGAGLAEPWPVHGPPSSLGMGVGWLLLALLAGRKRRHEEPARTARRRRLVVAAGLCAVAALPFVGWRGPAPAVRDPRVIFLDVGQGDAALVVPPAGAFWLIDAGPADGRYDAGRSIVDPALRAEGIAPGGIGVLTHAHQDHYGGFAWLAGRGWLGAMLENGSDARGVWRPPLNRALARGGLRAWPVERDTLLADGGSSRVEAWRAVHAGDRARTGAEENDRSIVLRFDLGPTSLGLLGDLEAAGEESLRQRLAPSDVLKAPHHGGRTSGGTALLERLAPRLAVISCGVGNRYGHPSREALGRFRRARAVVLRTDREGAIRVTVRGPDAWVSTRAHPGPIRLPKRSGARPPLSEALPGDIHKQ